MNLQTQVPQTPTIELVLTKMRAAGFYIHHFGHNYPNELWRKTGAACDPTQYMPQSYLAAWIKGNFPDAPFVPAEISRQIFKIVRKPALRPGALPQIGGEGLQ
jgi:hypothetical protein